MKEILITSSALIVALMLLRLVFSKKVSRTMIYAAWILVALRLLIPVQIGQLQFSVLTATQDVQQTVEQVATRPVSGPSKEEVFQDIVVDYVEKDQTVFIPQVQEQIREEISQGTTNPADIADKIQQKYPQQEIFVPQVEQQVQQQVEETKTAPTLGQIAKIVWLIGVAGMVLWFLLVNLRHGWLLRKDARKLDCQSPIPVYVSEEVASPCLVGLLRPVVYVTPRCAENPQLMRHVLNHELTHYRHGDHIWSLVRCICLCVYWFDPLVWAAAYMSRRDCELACDEGAMKGLGETERLAYGKTLLEVVSHAASPGKLLQTATFMNETMKQLKERVNFIVRKPKISITAAICMVLVCALIAGCVAAGPTSTQTNPPATTPPSTTQVADPTPQTPAKLLAMIPEDIQQRIKDEYLTRFYAQYPEDPNALDHTSLRVFGVFGDTYALFVDGPFAYFQVISRGTFGLIYPDSQNMYVYRDGHFYCDLEVAGMLTDAEIRQVVANYYAAYPFLQEALPTEPKPTDPQPTEPTQPTEPIDEELEKFNTLFGDEDSWYNRALTCEYASPTQISLECLFYVGFEGESRDPTDAEWAQLEGQRGFNINYDLMRLPVDKMNQVLTELFGITLEDMEDVAFEDVVYLESTNCYYHMVTDFLSVEDFNALSVENLADGTIRVYYTQNDWRDEIYAVTLMPHGDGYRILSNTACIVQNDLAEFNALFGDVYSLYNKALTCEYETPAQLGLMYFFLTAYNGSDKEASAAECAELKAVYGYGDYIDHVDVKRLPVDWMNQVLTELFGITLEDVEDAGFYDMDYLESTNCYYIVGGGASFAMDFNALSVENMEDGSIRVYYTQFTGSEDEMYVVTLMPYGDGYRILSNIALNTQEPAFTEPPMDCPLSKEVRQQISDAMYAQKRNYVYWKSGARYYGTYGNSIVFFVPDIWIGESFSQIGAYQFAFDPGGSLWVYKDGTIESLYDAYQGQRITDEQLAQIYSVHEGKQKTVFSTRQMDLDALKPYWQPPTQEVVDRINATYNKKTDYPLGFDGLNGYYGTYGDLIVVFSEGMIATESGIQVADYYFRCSSSYNIYVFTEDAMYDLRQAYEMGLLTYEQIAMVYTNHVLSGRNDFSDE